MPICSSSASGSSPSLNALSRFASGWSAADNSAMVCMVANRRSYNRGAESRPNSWGLDSFPLSKFLPQPPEDAGLGKVNLVAGDSEFHSHVGWRLVLQHDPPKRLGIVPAEFAANEIQDGEIQDLVILALGR